MTRRPPCIVRLLSMVAAVALVALVACDRGGGGGPDRARRSRQAPATTSSQELDLEQAWVWRPPPPASAGMPAADAGAIALTWGRRRVVLLDPAGQPRWETERIGVRDVAPLLASDLVVVPTDDGVVAYDRASGRLRWEAPLGERANAPVAAGARAVVTTWEGSLVGLDLADGRVAWRVSLGGDALGPAATAGSVAVATFDTGRVAGAVAVEAGTGRQRWTAPLPPGGVSAPAVGAGQGVGGGVVVSVAGDAAAHGLSLEDGSARWRRPVEGAGSPEVPPLALPDGSVLAAHRQGGVALLDAEDGEVRWEASSDGASVRGGPAGPGPAGWFALPLDDGRLLLARAGGGTDVRQPPDGLVSGVAAGAGGLLLIATGHGDGNGLTAVTGW